MSQVADSFNNPFKIDGKTLPPMRSALAILDVDEDEISDLGTEVVLERALDALNRDPEMYTVYGQPVHADDLRAAAAKLDSPADRALSRLLDYSFERFELGEVSELREAVDDYRDRLCREEALEVTDSALLGALVEGLCREPKIPADEPEAMEPPSLPGLEELLGDIA